MRDERGPLCRDVAKILRRKVRLFFTSGGFFVCAHLETIESVIGFKGHSFGAL